jgi:hypothetical protein
MLVRFSSAPSIDFTALKSNVRISHRKVQEDLARIYDGHFPSKVPLFMVSQQELTYYYTM